MCQVLQGVVDDAGVQNFVHTIFGEIPAADDTSNNASDLWFLETTVMRCLQRVWPMHSSYLGAELVERLVP